MKLRFKTQAYQTAAVDAVVDCFAGQPFVSGVSYRIDPGKAKPESPVGMFDDINDAGLRNAEIRLTRDQVLENIQAIQQAQNLPLSLALAKSEAAPGAPNLDVEMETGTGKTYVYIKTMMEMHKRYGWSKFIVVVPSVAIREGVKQSFDLTVEHFQQEYGTKPRTFIYDSKRLHELERFSSEAGVQVMIINIQAFNAAVDAEVKAQEGKRFSEESRRIMRELDDFQSRRPIDVIAANRPIVIVDEPQKMSSKKSLEAIAKFNPLMVLRYSATHKVTHDLVHRLDAVDAYNAKLVKKIAVRGITVKGLAGSTAYLYLDSIEVRAEKAPRARIELEVQTKGGPITRQVKWVEKGTNLHTASNGIEAYRPNGQALVVRDIDALRDVIELSTGDVVAAGQVTSDVTEESKRRIQIRESIRAHLDKERQLFGKGIKVLSLLFIDEVAKYRDYERDDTLGEYARVFEEEYALAVEAVLGELALEPRMGQYQAYLQRDLARAVHRGYFSIDKKTKREIDPAVAARGEEKGDATDVDAYDLILRDKERLLSLDEPVRFLFSHSALREGWDNPNVFVMGMLKRSSNVVSRRQEIGRGLRLAVNAEGERVDDPAVVHDINVLTVITDESYTDFVTGLQKEIAESLSYRPREATEAYFLGKTITKADGEIVVIDETLARAIVKYLEKADYLELDNTLTSAAKADVALGVLVEPSGSVEPAIAPIVAGLPGLLTPLFQDVPLPDDGRKPKRLEPNANYAKREFKQLWSRINHKAVYQVAFDSAELISKCVTALDNDLKVAGLRYVVESGVQVEALKASDVQDRLGFDAGAVAYHAETITAGSQVQYDLINEIAEKTELTRRTVAAVLSGVTPETFAKFRLNPEQFITETARIVNEQKASAVVEYLTYNVLDTEFDASIFTENQVKQNLTGAFEATKSIYDYVVTDSSVERTFAEALDKSSEVVVYTKLPGGFFIPTPLGKYNPDWAIAFQDGAVKHVYFVAETKGSMSSLQLRGAEEKKIEAAKKFFETLNAKHESVRYDVVTDYSGLMALVAG